MRTKSLKELKENEGHNKQLYALIKEAKEIEPALKAKNQGINTPNDFYPSHYTTTKDKDYTQEMLTNLDGIAKKMENYESQLNYTNKNNEQHNQELNAMLARLKSEEIQNKSNSYFQKFTNFVKTTYQQIIKIPSTILSFVSYYSANHGYQSIQNAQQNTDNATENNKIPIDL